MTVNRSEGFNDEPGIDNPRFLQNRERLLGRGANVVLATPESPQFRIEDLTIDDAVSVAYDITLVLDREFGRYTVDDDAEKAKIWGEATRSFFADRYPIFVTSPAAETFRVEVEKQEDNAKVIIESLNGTLNEVVDGANAAYIEALSLIDLKLPDAAALSALHRETPDDDPLEDDDDVIPIDEIETLEEYEQKAREFLGDEEAESEEDVLEAIAGDVKKRLRSFGIEKIGNTERIIDLLRTMDNEPSLLDDLTMLSIAHKRGVSKNAFAMPTFQTLEERGQIFSDHPQAVRTHIAETYAPFLQIVGYTAEDAKRLMRGSDDVNAAFRWVAILLSQDIMKDFPDVYKTEIAGKGTRKLQRTRLFSLARFEVKRQFDLHTGTKKENGSSERSSSLHELRDGDEVIIPRTVYKYDNRIEEDVEDYIKIEKALERTLATCDILFAVGR